jgi:2-oxoglutarate ferredoxin oxidoreductase subunit alpha
MMQARWGSHGPYEIIALCPSSPQEMFDFTIRAFNLAERYRLPVLIMADEVVGHMSERVEIPPEAAIKTFSRKKPKVSPERYLPYRADADGVAPMATFGEGYHMHVTGLTHDERGYPVMEPWAQEQMVGRMVGKIKNNAHKIMSYDTMFLDDAQVVVVAYGISARSAKGAVHLARQQGLKVGMVKLNTVWPFPEELIRDLAGRVKGLIMPEINLGQMVLELERLAQGRCQVKLVPHPGGAIISPRTVLAAMETMIKEGR